MRQSVKRSFFLTLLIYIALGAIIYKIDLKSPSIDHHLLKLSSMQIVHSKCSCQKCNPVKKSAIKTQKPTVQRSAFFHKKTLKTSKLLQKKPKRVASKVVRKLKKRKKHSHYKKKTIKSKHPKKQHQKILKTLKTTKKKQTLQKETQKLAPKPSQQVSRSNNVVQRSSAHQKQSKRENNYAKEFLTHYLLQIEQAIQRHKFYPRLARKTKKEGEVVVEFTLAPEGIKDLRLVKSSGHKILDRAALRTIQEASEEFLRPKQQIKIKVPLEYRLH